MTFNSDQTETLLRRQREADRLAQNLSAYGDADRSTIRNNPTQLAKYVGELAAVVGDLARLMGALGIEEATNAPADVPEVTDAVLQAWANHNRDHAHEKWPHLIHLNLGQHKGGLRWYRRTSVNFNALTGTGLVPVVFTPYGYADDPDA